MCRVVGKVKKSISKLWVKKLHLKKKKKKWQETDWRGSLKRLERAKTERKLGTLNRIKRIIIWFYNSKEIEINASFDWWDRNGNKTGLLKPLRWTGRMHGIQDNYIRPSYSCKVHLRSCVLHSNVLWQRERKDWIGQLYCNWIKYIT